MEDGRQIKTKIDVKIKDRSETFGRVVYSDFFSSLYFSMYRKSGDIHLFRAYIASLLCETIKETYKSKFIINESDVYSSGIWEEDTLFRENCFTDKYRYKFNMKLEEKRTNTHKDLQKFSRISTNPENSEDIVFDLYKYYRANYQIYLPNDMAYKYHFLDTCLENSENFELDMKYDVGSMIYFYYTEDDPDAFIIDATAKLLNLNFIILEWDYIYTEYVNKKGANFIGDENQDFVIFIYLGDGKYDLFIEHFTKDGKDFARTKFKKDHFIIKFLLNI